LLDSLFLLYLQSPLPLLNQLNNPERNTMMKNTIGLLDEKGEEDQTVADVEEVEAEVRGHSCATCFLVYL
jgi:hypothetical protein